MNSIKELFENQAVRLLIQDILSLRSGKKKVYEIAEEVADTFVRYYGHYQFKKWGDDAPKHPVLSADERELIVSVGFDQLLKSERFSTIVKETLTRNRGVKFEVATSNIVNELIKEYCFSIRKQEFNHTPIPNNPYVTPMFKTLVNSDVKFGETKVTDIYKEQKDKVQTAIDNLQRELEKATMMGMKVTLKGCDYPKNLITIESATREI